METIERKVRNVVETAEYFSMRAIAIMCYAITAGLVFLMFFIENGHQGAVMFFAILAIVCLLVAMGLSKVKRK